MQEMELPLRDIHMPDAIGWWPPAYGWWILIVALPLLVFVAVFVYKRLTRKTAQKTAMKKIKALKQSQQLGDREKVVELSALLRRAAMSVSGRSKVAGLTGKAWLAYLDGSFDGTPFGDGLGDLLLEAPYRKDIPDTLPIQEIFQLSEKWLNAQKKRPS